MTTAAVLALFVLSLVAQGLVVLLVRACYAAGKTSVPLMLNVVSSATTIFLALVLVLLQKHGLVPLGGIATLMRVPDIQGAEVLLVTFAYSVGAILNASLLLGYFARQFPSFIRRLAHTAAEAGIAAVCGGVGAYLALHLLDGIVSLHTVFGVLVQGAGAALVGLLTWALVLMSMGSEDMYTAWRALHKRLTRRRIGEARGSIEET